MPNWFKAVGVTSVLFFYCLVTTLAGNLLLSSGNSSHRISRLKHPKRSIFQSAGPRHRGSKHSQVVDQITRPQVPHISSNELEKIINEAMIAVDKRFDSVELNIYKNGAILKPRSPAWFAAASAKTKVVAKNYSRIALLSEEASRLIAEQYGLSKEQIAYALPTADIRGTKLDNFCPLTVDFPCQPKRYRAYSGYCNNVQHPLWGNANTGYVRYLNPDYADGVDTPRQSVRGGTLPGARLVSLSVHSDADRPHPHLTVFLAVFAEFVFHDIFHTSQTAGYRGHRIRCCDTPANLMHPECYPIWLTRNGSSRKYDFCMDYVRSSSAPRIGCTLGPREQINQVTSFLDGSVVYGSSVDEVSNLRTFRVGLMKTQRTPDGAVLLPPDLVTQDCKTPGKCFVAGDVRVNENAGLMVMHTMWVREHNRIASELSVINPHWDDEQLFEESRRIIAAQIQHITYAELLTAILGVQVTNQFDLNPLSSGFYSGYDINVNPGTSNVVASAVGGFFYSMMPSQFELYSRDLRKVGAKPTSDTNYQPNDIYNAKKLNEYLLGMTKQRAEKMDEFITKEMTNNLFMDKELGIGMDVAAAVVQQGRDHGIPGYIEWRKICRLSPPITNFTDLEMVMASETAKKIAGVYKDVRDIDLFTGGLSENPLVGGVVGPTFACLISRQFQQLRKGDRYWYENDIPSSAFTKDQLSEIKKSSLTNIICNNVDGVHVMQPSVMRMPDSLLNALQNCETGTPSVDLTKWKTVPPLHRVSKDAITSSFQVAKRQALERTAAEWEIFSNSSDICSYCARTHVRGIGPVVVACLHNGDWPLCPSIRVTPLLYPVWVFRCHALELQPFRDWPQHFNQLYVASTDIGVADARSPQAVHHIFLRPKRQALIISNQSLVLELASQEFMHNAIPRDHEEKLSDSEVSRMMTALSSQDITEYLETNPEDPGCREENLPCDYTSIFRTVSGWCNNLKNPDWGKSLSTFQRLLPPQYSDGVSSPRSISVTGEVLPSPRLVSSTVHYEITAPHSRYSLALMQWGQFLDHDLTLTPMYEAFGRKPLDCKSCNSASTIHPECLPIPVPENDPFFPSTNSSTGQPTCISFARSLAGQRTMGRREQLDQVTSFIDASNIYGSDICESRMLRTFKGGLMNSTRHPISGKDLLPQDITNPECRAPSGICFEAGDIRASEQPSLTSMHTIWMREHNRMVRTLRSVNPHWTDELLYQHGRRIISAMLQHITFNEFLPRVLGYSHIKAFGLDLQTDGYYEGYEKACNPTIYNEFSSSAFRFGHTLLKPILLRLDKGYEPAGIPIRLRQAFFNPDMLYTVHAIDHILRGILSNSVEVFDHSITEEVTNHLFEDSKVAFSGMDLASLNLQRGRDHGIPAYNNYRVLCNRSQALLFDDLIGDIPDHIVQKLKSVYQHVDDIDLFTGGLAEIPMYGALVGPTVGCIIAMQFRNLRKCDRFWYETVDPFIRFTEGQLSEIRKTSLSKVICDNSDSIEQVQLHGMDLPDVFLNPRMPCKSLQQLDLRKWRDSSSCAVDNASHTISIGHSTRVSPCKMCSCTKEGLFCQSLKIQNCFELATKFSKKSILDDNVCKVQCAFAFRTYPQLEVPLENVLGFSTP